MSIAKLNDKTTADNLILKHKNMTVIDHLDEFRSRLIRCCIFILILSFITYDFSLDAIIWLKHEFCPELEQIVFTRPLELFMIRLKVSICLALMLGIPYISYELWKYITPALLKKEKKGVFSFALTSSIFFIIGGIFALFIILPSVLRFALEMQSSEIVPMITVESFINLAALLILGFGVMFQLPVIVFILLVNQYVKVQTLNKSRPYIVCVVFLGSAILTPPDILSMLAMGVPTLALFEISLLIGKVYLKIHSKHESIIDK